MKEGTIIELERKWVLKRLPKRIKNFASERIDLLYIYKGNERYCQRKKASDPEAQYWVTIKEGEGAARKETQRRIEWEDFIMAAQDGSTKTLSKTRYIIDTPAGQAEVDEYDSFDLVTMEFEIEIPVYDYTDENRKDFQEKNFDFGPILNPLIVADVTDLPGFKNINLAEAWS